MRTASLFLLLAVGAASESGPAERLRDKDRASREHCEALPVFVVGRAIDEEGLGVRAAVEVGGVKAVADRRGWFRLDGLTRRNAVLTVTADGFFNELRAIELALPSTEPRADAGTIRLWARRPGRCRVVLGGDAMLGRRFLKPDTPEAPPSPLLRPDSLAADAETLLAGVAPFLRAADLAVVNLESAVGRGELAAVSKKAHNFWSPPEALDALRGAGVDGVTLGNNHCWDFGAAGLERTLAELDGRKIGRCGAGLDEAGARRAMGLAAGGAEFRVLSYSGIRGEDVPLLAQGARGGAAPLSAEAVAEDVAREAKGGTVIVALHSGFEYRDRAGAQARAAARAAARNGAALVVGHHPHMLGGFALDGDTLIARGLGNFVFDQTRWEALPGMLLVADFQDGRVARASIIPIVSDGFVPRPAAGAYARWIVRRVGALSEGAPVYWSAGRGVVAIDEPHRFTTERVAALPAGVPVRVAHEDPAASLAAVVAPEATIEAGRDLLRVGGFEDDDADAEVLEGGIWTLSDWKRISVGAARTGAAGLLVIREAGARRAVTATRLRVPVPAKFTIAGWTRAENAGDLTVECDWCADLEMVAMKREAVRMVKGGTRGWTPFHADVTRPEGAFSMRLRLASAAPAEGVGQLWTDDVAVIAWAPVKGPLATPNDAEWVRLTGKEGDVGVRLEYEHFAEP
ncbi:MAG: CapA family protein [Planctomycetes bacterium]|nr:CapA family protein [Planctomycetota bacterium]